MTSLVCEEVLPYEDFVQEDVPEPDWETLVTPMLSESQEIILEAEGVSDYFAMYSTV